MEKIILIGGGGHCKSCIDVIESEGKFKIAGIIDTKDRIGQKVLNYNIIASDEELPELSKEYNYFFITLGQIKSPEHRVRIYNILKQLKVNLPAIISPYAYVSSYATIGEGTIIMNRAFINADARIGRNCIINTGAIIEHDAIIEDNCHISTGAIVNGGVVVRENSFIGSNSILREYIDIGNNSVIGAGLRMMKGVPSSSIIKIDL